MQAAAAQAEEEADEAEAADDDAFETPRSTEPDMVNPLLSFFF